MSPVPLKIKSIAIVTIWFISISAMVAQSDMKQAIQFSKKCVVAIVCKDIDSKGTGFIVHKNGFVLTCNHVVAHYVLENNILKRVNYSDSIYVRFDDGTELRATIAFTQPLVKDKRPLLYDYAILKIEGESFTPVEYGSYGSVEEGSDVYFCGYPLSSSHLTTHKGMVSAMYTSEGPFNRTVRKVIQIDGAINKGNSGGPLFDLATQKVIGMISTREGGISKELDELRQYITNLKKNNTNGFYIEGVDPLPVMASLINTIDTYISVGIGHAISLEYAMLHLKELVTS
jgi:S1-C subfamily serine protease